MLRVSADLVDGPAALFFPIYAAFGDLHCPLLKLSHGFPLTKIRLLILNTAMMTVSFLFPFYQRLISEILIVKAKHSIFSSPLGLSLLEVHHSLSV